MQKTRNSNTPRHGQPVSIDTKHQTLPAPPVDPVDRVRHRALRVEPPVVLLPARHLHQLGHLHLPFVIGVLLLRMFFALFCTIWRVRLK